MNMPECPFCGKTKEIVHIHADYKDPLSPPKMRVQCPDWSCRERQRRVALIALPVVGSLTTFDA